MSIATKLQKILDSKAAIKTAINGKGGTITDSTPLDEYADAIDGLPTGLPDDVFAGIIDSSVSGTVVIPNGCTKIERYKFIDCANLTGIVIPEGVTSIGTQAFASTGLLSITIPNSVTSLPGTVVNGSPLRSFVFGRGVTDIPALTLSALAQLKYVFVPDVVTSIGANGMRVLPASTTFTKFVFEGETPPTITSSTFITSQPYFSRYAIYVPDAAVATYKNATNWSALASVIFPMSDYTE